MTQYPKDGKKCATCAYWTGTRRPNNVFAERVEVESAEACGKCLCRDSCWWNKDRPAAFSCAKFQKWQVLK